MSQSYMKHSRYNEYFNYMSGNSKKNIKKDENGNVNNDVSTIINNFDEKLLYWTELVHDKYGDKDFYLLRHEFNKLHRALLAKENVMFSTSKIFTYKGKKHECIEMSLILVYGVFEQSNKQIVFHDFYRDKKNGEIIILAKSTN